MTMTNRMEGRLRFSGILIALGLLIEAFSLARVHRLAFLTFMFIGGALLIAGMAIYLYSLASVSTPPDY